MFHIFKIMKKKLKMDHGSDQEHQYKKPESSVALRLIMNKKVYESE